MKISRKKVQNEFIKRIEELSGVSVANCYQCGKCSAGCPLGEYMDILPNQIIRLIQLGSIDEILESETVWFCSSCLQCSSKCPKGVDIATVMETIREILRREGINKIKLEEITKEMWRKIPQQAIVSGFRKYSP